MCIFIYNKIMNIKMVMKLAAGHSVSNMFSSYIPPPNSYGSFFFFVHVDKEMMAIQPVCELN